MEHAGDQPVLGERMPSFAVYSEWDQCEYGFDKDPACPTQCRLERTNTHTVYNEWALYETPEIPSPPQGSSTPPPSGASGAPSPLQAVGSPVLCVPFMVVSPLPSPQLQHAASLPDVQPPPFLLVPDIQQAQQQVGPFLSPVTSPQLQHAASLPDVQPPPFLLLPDHQQAQQQAAMMPPPAMASVVPGQAALNHAVHVEPPRPNHQQAQPAQQPVQQPAQQPAQQPTQQAAAVRDHALAWPPSEGRPSAQGKRGRGRRGRGSRALDVLEPPVRHASTEPAPATERATAASPVRRTSPRGRRASEAPLPRALPAAAAVATELEWTKGWREEMKKRLSESSDQDIAQVLQMELRGKVWQMARHKEATRVIQEAIETTKAEQFAHFRAPLLAELRGKCKEAAGDSVANHVIEAVITKAPPLDSAFIARELLPHARDTVRTPKGCRLVIRLIEFARASLPTGALIDEIARACVDLCYNQYGRKVIQKILEHSEAHRHGIAEAILPQVCDMAKDKQGSYVVEAALRTCSSDDQDKLALALAADVLDVWACKFGKYPVERLLNMSATTTQQQVSRAVREKIFAVQAADLQAFGPTGIVNAHLPELGAMAQAQH